MGRNDRRVEVIIGAVDRVAAPIRRINRRIESMLSPIRRVGRSLRALSREAGLNSLGRGIRSIGRGFRNLAFVGVAAVGAIVAGVRQMASAGDDIGKMARRLGLTSEAFQELEFAADRSGVTQSVYRQSIGALAKRIGELRAGTGALSTLLGRADPGFKKLLKSASGTEEAFGLVLERIRKLKNPLDKNALAAAAFSRAGLSMVQMSELGVEGLAALRAEGVALGGVMTGEQTRASESFTDSLTNLQFSMKGLRNIIGFELLPEIQKIVDKMTKWIVANREWLRDKVVEGLKGIATAGRKVFNWLKEVLPKVDEFVDKLGGMKPVFKLLGSFILIAIAPLRALAALIDLVVDGLLSLSAGVKAFSDGAKTWISPVLNLVSKTASAIGTIGLNPAVAIAGGPTSPGSGAVAGFGGGGGQAPVDLRGTIKIEVDASRAAPRVDASISAPGIDFEAEDTGVVLPGE